MMRADSMEVCGMRLIIETMLLGESDLLRASSGDISLEYA